MINARMAAVYAGVCIAGCVWSGEIGSFDEAIKEHGSNSFAADKADDAIDGAIDFFFGGSDEEPEPNYYSRSDLQGWKEGEESLSNYDVSGTSTVVMVRREVREDSSIDSDILHRRGTMATPLVRFDYRWQDLDDDLQANDYLLETGYSYGAFLGRMTRYSDDTTRERLNIDEYYLMARIGADGSHDKPGWSCQLAGGIGAMNIKRDETLSGFSLTVPITLTANDFWGLEFRPAWAHIRQKLVSDYDISISAGYRYAHLRAGYRWFWVQGDGKWLDGGYVGVTTMF